MAEPEPQNIPHRLIYMPPDYKVDGMLGSGTFAQVYRATHRENHDVIALKCFRYNMCTASNYRLAAKEIAFLSILEHPNILQLKLYEVNKTYVYIGTEFAAFGSLRCYLRDRQPISELVIRFVMRQLLSALCYLHEMGVFHGDVKPENILCIKMSEYGPVIKIGDFGLSEIKLKGDDNMFFKSGSFLYMAPEVHLRYPVDCSCDLWSAGIIMYVMMFARNIFKVNEKDRRRQMAFLKRRVQPNWAGSDRYSPECNSLVRGLLSYDKQNRPTGQVLRCHPFVRINNPIIPDAESFLNSAQDNIRSAFAWAEVKKYGEALVKGTQAIMKLKIHYNLIENGYQREHVKAKWEEYLGFTSDMEQALVRPDDLESTCPCECDDDKFRRYLASTPKLIAGFDIGTNAEMYLKEGNKKKALEMFHQALQVLLPLMKGEPRSNRKEILGRRMQEWIRNIELITDELPPDDEEATVVALALPSTSASIAYAVPQE